MITKAFKFRIYPTDEQIVLLNKTFGCVRYVYNHFLDFKQTEYKRDKSKYSFNQCCKLLTSLKEEIEWLREPDKCCI